MKKITVIVGVLLVSSCGMFTPMSDEERKINYKIDKLYLEYQYKRDSMLIEFYKNQEPVEPTAYLHCCNCDEID
jgi:hypothetical protein|tara:strand:- start:327 stop:548 length:222 start_codon:yes stop_codon:yes gene_type:complete